MRGLDSTRSKQTTVINLFSVCVCFMALSVCALCMRYVNVGCKYACVVCMHLFLCGVCVYACVQSGDNGSILMPRVDLEARSRVWKGTERCKHCSSTGNGYEKKKTFQRRMTGPAKQTSAQEFE